MQTTQITRILSDQVVLAESIIVTRVRPRTSKGITDLLLPQTSLCLEPQSPSKKPTTIEIAATS